MSLPGQIFLAAAFEEQVKRATQGQLDTRDLLIGLTVAVALGIAIVLWFVMRSRMKSNSQDQERLAQMMRGHGGARRKKTEPEEKKPAKTITEDGLHRRRKRRRREHRQRNPSLAETGGLPPPRPDDQLPKY